MAYNMDMSKGLYPGEPGYNEWPISKFPTEMAIEGTLNKKFKYIHPQDFHSKFLKNGLCTLDNPTYTDIKVRNDIEMTNNKRYFQPKVWNLNKLLYNYNSLWHLNSNDLKFMNTLTKFLKKHIQDLYEEYNVNIKQRAFKPNGDWYDEKNI
tara:strand:- start:54 stop:506 length:453 start_codon:yes stop_codon:yes gene_type:complete